VIEQQDLEERLKADLETRGFPHSPKGSSAEGWKVFLFQGHGEAALMWARPDDREKAEARIARDLDDQYFPDHYRAHPCLTYSRRRPLPGRPGGGLLHAWKAV
jgi:hypothetical protein